MSDRNLYIIAGCNGAGKTTASFTILPEIMECREFVNADEIARGLSPFRPERAAVEAGRIMLQRMDALLAVGETFAFETTLASKSYKAWLIRARREGYNISLLFFWLQNVEMAKERVRIRVQEGGHDIAPDVIERRYRRGIQNLFQTYLPLVYSALIFDNSFGTPELIAEQNRFQEMYVLNNEKFTSLKVLS